MGEQQRRQEMTENISFILLTGNITAVIYLMFLPPFALLLNLLLFLQFLCDASLSEGLALASFVGFGIKGGLQSRVTTHAHHYLLTQLFMDKITKMGSSLTSPPWKTRNVMWL